MSSTASSTNYDRILADLKRLKLSTIRTHLDDHLRLAQSKSLTYLEFLQGLTAEELRGREESNYRRRLKSARFPAAKSLEEFDYVQCKIMWSRPALRPTETLAEPNRLSPTHGMLHITSQAHSGFLHRTKRGTGKG